MGEEVRRLALESPLLGPGTFLDARRRSVVARVSAAERAGILALPSDDPLDAKRRRRVEATLGEMMGQPAAVSATWERNADALGVVARRIVAGSGRPSARGSVTVKRNVLPAPGLLSIVRSPSIARAMRRTKTRPRPAPP